MSIQNIHLILYVSDQAKSRDFYAQILDLVPVLDVPGMTEFQIGADCKLGLMPENGIAKLIHPQMPHPQDGSGIPRCELYLKVEQVNPYFERAIAAGAKLIQAATPMNWGDTVAYMADLDGHIVAIAETTRL